MRTWGSCLLLLAGLVSASLAGLCLPADVLYPVDILLITTSDWTDVRLVGATLVIDGYEVVDGGDATNLNISTAGGLSVSRAIEGDMRVEVRFRGYFAQISGSWVRIEVQKGHLGNTTVSFLPRDGTTPTAFASYIHRGVAPGSSQANQRTFSLAVSQITSRIEPWVLPAPSESSIGGQKVLAFYYPWYGSPDGPSDEWVHWNPLRANRDSTHVPAAGYYDSLDPETVRRHIGQAKEAGIDGFIASWWGLHTFEDRAFGVLLEAAEQEDFLVTVYYESAELYSQIVSDVSAIVSRYASSPAFLVVDGLPAIFFYVRVISKFTVEEWERAFEMLDQRNRSIFAIADSLDPRYLEAFEGLHTYNPVAMTMETTAELYRSASLAARMKGNLFAATVLPGYEEAVYRPTSPRADRDGGDTYHAYWDLAKASKPHWILITSFNEWHEGSEIEPSVEFGTHYLEQTLREAAAWRAGEAIPDEPAPIPVGDSGDRDGDGVPDSEDFCPDWPGDPTMNGC